MYCISFIDVEKWSYKCPYVKANENKKHNVEKHVKWIHVSIPIMHIWRCSYYDSLYQGQKHISNLTYLTKY